MLESFRNEVEKALIDLMRKGREIGLLSDDQSLYAELQIQRGKDPSYEIRATIYPDSLTLDQVKYSLELSPRAWRITSRTWINGFLKSSRAKESQRLAITRAKISLHREGYLTLGEIKLLGSSFFESFPNCGFVTVVSLGRILQDYGLIPQNSSRVW